MDDVGVGVVQSLGELVINISLRGKGRYQHFTPTRSRRTSSRLTRCLKSFFLTGC